MIKYLLSTQHLRSRVLLLAATYLVSLVHLQKTLTFCDFFRKLLPKKIFLTISLKPSLYFTIFLYFYLHAGFFLNIHARIRMFLYIVLYVCSIVLIFLCRPISFGHHNLSANMFFYVFLNNFFQIRVGLRLKIQNLYICPPDKYQRRNPSALLFAYFCVRNI